MTRINASIQVTYLCDQHLLAEHREIVRVRLTQNSKQEVLNKFSLGKGHTIFFKDKLGYIYNRYLQLYNECKIRGFNVTDMRNSFSGFDLSGTYIENNIDYHILKDRLTERLLSMKSIKFYSKNITAEEAIKLIN